MRLRVSPENKPTNQTPKRSQLSSFFYFLFLFFLKNTQPFLLRSVQSTRSTMRMLNHGAPD